MAQHAGTAEVRMDRQGRLVVPADLRQRLGFAAGERLVARVEGEKLILERADAIIERIRKDLREAAGGASLVDELIADRREEVRREELD